MHEIIKTYKRIKNHIINTPLISSSSIDKETNNRVFFKLDSLQKTKSFKFRSILNHLLCLKERDLLPKKIVSYSTGNHAIALGYIANMLGIKARIYLPKNVYRKKRELAKNYNLEIIDVDSRKLAEEMTLESAKYEEFYYLHPSAHIDTILGCGTMLYEVFIEMKKRNLDIDYIFLPIGGGGLASGSYIVKDLFIEKAKIIGAEPENANDAFRSYRDKIIYRFDNSPDTIADGLKTLSLSNLTFEYIKKLDDLITVSENEIIDDCNFLTKRLDSEIEHSSAVAFSGAQKYLKQYNIKNKNIVILISGGNV